MANKYVFNIENTEANKQWCQSNLDERDYEIVDNVISIAYYNTMQKNDILAALLK
jgi:hypothetical protein